MKVARRRPVRINLQTAGALMCQRAARSSVVRNVGWLMPCPPCRCYCWLRMLWAREGPGPPTSRRGGLSDALVVVSAGCGCLGRKENLEGNLKTLRNALGDPGCAGVPALVDQGRDEGAADA